MLPDFVVIGAQKSGTTSLYNYLALHPAILPAARKEVHFFDLNYGRGVDWYRSHFPTRRRVERCGRRLGTPVLTGEASPYYLFYPDAPGRLHALLPHARLIVLLRDPVSRAVSHHNHEVQDGFETLPLQDALEAEPSRLAAAAHGVVDGTPAAFSHLHHSYLSRGRYAEQLDRWFAYFPRDQFLILDSRELFADPGAAFERTLTFLGLAPHDLGRYENSSSRRPPPLDADLRRRLDEYFAPYNERLYRLLGTDFGWGERARDDLARRSA